MKQKITASFEKEQWEKLKSQVKYMQENSPFYRKLFSSLPFDPSDFSPADFAKLPPTTKQNLGERNNDFISVPRKEIIDYVTTSGTLGTPVTIALNEHDLQRLAINEESSFQMVGVSKNDVVQITTTLDRRFMAGMAYFLGLRKLGAGIVRVGSGLPELQWDSIKRFQPKFLIAVPSFLIKLAEYGMAQGIDINNSSVKGAICIGEALLNQNFEDNALAKKIKQLWNIELFSTYASTEMATAFTECSQHRGNHVQENLIYTEVVNEDGYPVKSGEVGELLVTPLGVQTTPLLRFATGDMVRKITECCACGRAGTRLSPVLGRKQQRIKYKGTSLYPQQISEILNAQKALDNFLIRVKSDSVGNDLLEIILPDTISSFQKNEIEEILQGQLRVLPKLIFWEASKISTKIFPPKNRKPVLFIDLRKVKI